MLSFFLPVAQVDVWWPGLVLLGFLIGIVTGLFGLGGGFLLTPSLRIFFNISYPVAIGSSLLQIVVTSLLSAYKHWRQKNLDVKMGAIAAGGSLLGAECGIRLLRLVGDQGMVLIGGRSIAFIDLMINSSFLILLTAVGISMYREACQSQQCGIDEPETALADMVKSCPLPPFVCFEQSNIDRLSIWVPIALSFAVGCLTGLLGIGGGFINLPLLIYFLGLPTRIAVGTSTAQVLLASGYGTLRLMQAGNVDIILVLFMLVGSVGGVNTGVRLAKLVNPCNTRKYFAALMALAIGLILFDLARRLVF
ncbi:MAG: sulfite exporter TauE/SafE family protein [Negativicutes bacterium]|nr:sulfite exporter TauE/SafE family protein [Negativicutes bacterium]MDR3592860.1 sulfite exporter TauE/SafE family protein [Negativicutes bacterium]